MGYNWEKTGRKKSNGTAAFGLDRLLCTTSDLTNIEASLAGEQSPETMEVQRLRIRRDSMVVLV